MIDSTLPFQSIASLSRQIASGETTSLTLTENCLGRIESLDSTLNAFRLVTPETAIAQAKAADARRHDGDKSPLLGIPYAAKDLFDVKGLPTTAGSHLLEQTPAKDSASVIKRLQNAGMVFLGKTNTVQFAYGGIGVNHDHGTPQNPWHKIPYAPGGSSSGSGVAVAAGLCPMALGTDTGGSVRIPAALCGVTGLKTTVGQVPRTGVFPLSWTLDSVGPLTRTVEDAALVYEIIQGADDADPTTHGRPKHHVASSLHRGVKGLNLAFAESVFFDDIDDDVEAKVRATSQVFESLGAKVSHHPFQSAKEALKLNSRGLVAAAEAWTVNRELIESDFENLDPIVSHRVLKGKAVTANDYLTLQSQMLNIRAQAMQDFGDYDILIAPTSALPAKPISILDASEESYAGYNLSYLRNTAIGNILNLCGISVPCGHTRHGLPVGLMLYGRPYHEETVLRVAQAFQIETDYHTLVPDLAWINA